MTRCMGCMEEYSEQFNVCPHCGYVKNTPPQEAIHIKPGTVLSERYIVGKVIGYGGFGVTYIGFDTRLQQKVAIKEYFPTEFSTRMPGNSRITVLGEEKGEQFFDGLEKFLGEAKRLAKFHGEEGIVRVFDSFTENDTAYIVMEYLDGETLTAYMDRCGTIPENEAVKMLEPVMKSLQTVHEAGILHRDIAPDNIFITKSGNVKLIDFGASRYATTSYSRSLTVIIKPGYSPEEQYRSRGDQGAHTDVYAIGATLYKMITGITPPDAMKRRAMLESKNKDILEEPHRINKNLSINRENAILNAMNIRIEDRTPDMMTFYRELHSDKPAKRIYGKVKKLDLYSWPLWAKIVVPTAALAVIISAVLLLTGIISFDSPLKDEIVVPDGMTTVPNIEGMLLEEAEEELQEANLLYSIDKNVESEYVDPGKVVYQTPKDGAYLDINGTVSIAVSRGVGVESPEGNEATVPFLTACTLEEALELLEEAGLGAPIIEYELSDSVPEGQIISQSVEYGEKVEVGTQVTLTISSGPPKFAMPDVVGVEVGNAKNGLTKAGFVVKVQNENGEEADEGVVIAQSIPAGTEFTKGAEIVLTVSNDEDVTSVSKEVTAVTMPPATVTTAQVTNAVTTTTTTKVTTAATTKVTTRATTTTTKVTQAAVKKVTVSFNAGGGSCDYSSYEYTVGAAYGFLPTPQRNYHTFVGWYTALSGGTKVTTSTVVSSDSDYTIYARWSANSVSDWVLASEMPDDAMVYDRKWTYTLTETTTSTSSSMSGWTQTGYTWQQSGTGTHYYASYPSGFSTSHSLYSKYNKSAISGYENTSTKRTVSSASFSTYIYWHWTQVISDGSVADRIIQSSRTGSYTMFTAVENATDYSYRSYAGAYEANLGSGTVSKWWFRFDVYKQTYTDYQKLYSYQKTTSAETYNESDISASGVSNVKEYVQYIPK